MAIEYKLQIECSDLQAEVLINDLPAFSREGKFTKNSLINHWVIDGNNRIGIRLNIPVDFDPVTANSYFELKLTEGDETLYSFLWNPSDTNAPLPVTTRRGFNSNTNFGEWVWQNAEQLELNEATINEINRFLQRIYESLNSANIGETLNLFRIKAEEQAIAFGIPTDERLFQQRSFFEQWFSEAGWGMEKINYDLLNYRLCADGRVVFVSYKNSSDVLQSKPVGDGEMVSFPLFISKLEGRWIIVR